MADKQYLAMRDAFGFWLADRPISLPTAIEDGCKAAMENWLEEHTEELIERVAKEARVVLFPRKPPRE